MGSLTDDMTRLCGEIVALRGLRQAFVQDLVRTVAQLKAGFRQAHEQMSRETREGRAKAVLDLKMSVAGLRQDNFLDLKGAHRAWFGPATSQGPKPAREPVRQTSPKTGDAARRPAAKGGKPGGAPAAKKRPAGRDQKKPPG
jgi:hypothetical protein